MGKKDKRIDDYILKANDFARPVLEKFRELMHKACPEVEESIKWGMPSFEYNGILAHMASFKKHCAIGFKHADIMKDPDKIFVAEKDRAMSAIGKISGIEDLPSDKILLKYIKEAATLSEKGVKGPSAVKPVPPLPAAFKKALKEQGEAFKIFENFPPGAKREYIEWITEAKTEATRHKRIEQAVEWISEGKRRNWKYQAKQANG